LGEIRLGEMGLGEMGLGEMGQNRANTTRLARIKFPNFRRKVTKSVGIGLTRRKLVDSKKAKARENRAMPLLIYMYRHRHRAVFTTIARLSYKK